MKFFSKNLNKQAKTALNQISCWVLVALFASLSLAGNLIAATEQQREDVLRNSSFRDAESGPVCTTTSGSYTSTYATPGDVKYIAAGDIPVDGIDYGVSIYGGSWNGSQWVISNGNQVERINNGEFTAESLGAIIGGTGDDVGIGNRDNPLHNTVSYAELNLGKAMGGLPNGAKIEVSYKGKSIIAERADIGGGGGSVDGKTRAVDLWWEAARLLDFKEGLAVMKVRAVDIATPTTTVSGGVPSVVAPSSGTCSCSASTSDPSGSLVTDKSLNLGVNAVERQSKLIELLQKDFGLSAEQAAGIVGNLMVESGREDLPPDRNEGDSGGAPPKFSGGYGWAQWTGERQVAFIDFAVSNGFIASNAVNANDAANYGFLKKELTETYASSIVELKTKSDPASAAESFMNTYEKPGIPNLDQRKANAQTALSNYSAGTVSVAASSFCGGSAAIVGDKAFPLVVNKSGIEGNGIFSNGTTDKAGHPYTAYDILVPEGTPVVAFTSGTVTHLGEDKCPGRLVGIYNETSSAVVSYLHLDFNNLAIGEGDVVAVGSPIGLVGPASAGCGVEHLHIDAAQGTTRPGCKRENCPAENASKFIDIGPDLFTTFQALPE